MQSEARAAHLRKIVTEREKRLREALRLYEPLPAQVKLHESRAPELIVRGSNRGGKTTPVMVELARAVTGQDPHNKYPKENGRVIVVGKDEDHIGGVFFRKLFRPGAFKIIRDAVTKQWRAFRPWEDEHRAHEARPAPPLIPERFLKGGSLKGVAWTNKKKNVLRRVELENGWEIKFYSSLGKPPQGVDVDLVIFDEEIEDPDWYPEMAARLVDRSGRFLWSATPQNGTDALYALSERAKEEGNNPNPGVVEIEIYLDDNKFLTDKQRNSLKRKFADSPEEYNIRILGQFNRKAYLVYPDFSMSRLAHGCALYHPDHERDGLVIDDSFNLYMFVDPGRAICAAAFWAVPPPNHPRADQRFLFDELYIRQCNSEIFAESVLGKIAGRRFTGFYIDPSSTRQDTIGGGPSVFAQYGEALAKRKIACTNSGSSFVLSPNDKTAGIQRFALWMHVLNETGRPKLQVVEGRCPSFEREIKFYRNTKKRTPSGDVYFDKPVDANDHLMDCCYPMSLIDPVWQKPPTTKVLSPAYALYKQLKEKEDARNRGSETIHLGPGARQSA